MTASIIFDIICAAIIVICVAYFASKGFLAGLLSLVGTLVSIVVSFFVSRALSPWLFEHVFRNPLIERTQATIDEQAGATIQQVVDAIIGFLPDFVTQPLVDQMDGGGLILLDTGLFAARVVDDVFGAILIPLIAVVLFLLIFILLRLLVGLLLKLLRGVNRIPVLGPANRVLGGVSGIVVGLVYVFLLVTVLSLAQRYSSLLSTANTFISKSIFFQLFSGISLFPG